ncbi:hypothetical protein pdam_00024785 [Pocillopora damicornis]|uniref:Uncharacterized protein n=1 Tax=Pocillopora damicornis TaxID=46731 RepID=A0A3M6TUT5_POCDA|nr:hypothetical protein pdam_00024785 [Pocillopora damicornis]
MFKCVERGFSFKFPSNILIVVPTSCGKTTCLHHLLLENLDVFDERPPTCTTVMDPGKIRVPTHDDLTTWFGDKRGGILVLNDIMSEGDDKEILKNKSL